MLANPFEICILAGGLSTRMGRDKTRLRLGTRTLLAHVRALAKTVGAPVRIVRVDRVPRCGPLGGICTALEASSADAVLFLSCDMPFLKRATLRKLMSRTRQGDGAVFLEHQGIVGFPFVIRCADLPQVRRRLAVRGLSLQTLARSLKAMRLRLPAGMTRQLFNINTPEDLKLARRFWREANLRTRRKSR